MKVLNFKSSTLQEIVFDGENYFTKFDQNPEGATKKNFIPWNDSYI